MSFHGSPELTIPTGGPVNYYYNYTTTQLYVEKYLGSGITSLTVSNDSSTDTVSVSYDGATLEAELLPGETITLNINMRKSVYICGAAGGGTVRIWAA